MDYYFWGAIVIKRAKKSHKRQKYSSYKLHIKLSGLSSDPSFRDLLLICRFWGSEMLICFSRWMLCEIQTSISPSCFRCFPEAQENLPSSTERRKEIQHIKYSEYMHFYYTWVSFKRSCFNFSQLNFTYNVSRGFFSCFQTRTLIN